VETRLDSVALASRLVTDHRVAVVPGSAFGLGSGCYLRVSYGALDPQTVAEGMTRLVDGLETIVGRA
jgi:aspartate/methionine/tyrosine aminotransferase